MQYEQPASDAHRHVGNVEYVEFYCGNVDKINDVSAKRAVDHVADPAADDQCQRYAHEAALRFFAKQIYYEQYHCEGGQEHEHPAVIGEHPECGTAIFNVCESQHAGDDIEPPSVGESSDRCEL